MVDEGQLEYRGLTLGTGTAYHVTNIEGLRGLATRVGDTPIPRGDGSTPGDHHAEAKRPVLSIAAEGDYDDVVPDVIEAFRLSRSDEHPLVWVEGGEEVRLYVRPVDVPIVRQAPPNLTRIDVGLKATDPRVYGQQRSITLSDFDATGGTTNFPVNFPLDFSAESGNDKQAINNGTSDAHPQITIDGPNSGSADKVEITNTTNGSKLVLTASIGTEQTLTFRTREWVTRRLDTLIVELDGANRYDKWDNRASFLYLSPGDNRIQYQVTSGTGEGTRCTLSWRDTFDGLRRDE